jgi:uncharacterized protein YecE (DUF72 family)
MARGAVRIGTSGYQYNEWRGGFYPEGLPKRKWFDHYAGVFDTVEINNTFYGLPETDRFDEWRERAPEGFLYALKYNRYATHRKRLRDPEGALGEFLPRAERLGSRLGPILVQLPPRWHADPERLRAFLEAAGSERRWAIEFRDPDWLRDEIYDLLHAHNAALVIHDLIEDHPIETPSMWVYLRFHGKDYAHGYSPQALTAWAERIASWRVEGRDVYAYFNNDVGGHAPRDAQDLRRHVSRALERAASGA